MVHKIYLNIGDVLGKEQSGNTANDFICPAKFGQREFNFFFCSLGTEPKDLCL